MLTERLLPPSEWPRLAGTLMDPAWRTLSTSDKVIVVEDDGQIVACTSLSQHWHMEASWIHPAYRGRVSVGRRVIRVVRALFKALHIGEVFMMATNDRTAAMCQKMGQSVTLPQCFAVIVEEEGRPVVWQTLDRLRSAPEWSIPSLEAKAVPLAAEEEEAQWQAR